MSMQYWTMAVILVTALLWIAYDIYIYMTRGNPMTESATMYRWSYQCPGFALLCGILVGHLFFPQTSVISEVAQQLSKCVIK